MQKRQIIAIIALAFAVAFSAADVSAAVVTATIRIEGMHCGGCASSIDKKLKATEGVEDARVSFDKKEAWVKYDESKITVAQLREVINSTGFKAVEEKSTRH